MIESGGGGGGLLLLSVLCLLEISYEILPRGCDVEVDRLSSPGLSGDCGVPLSSCAVCVLSYACVSCLNLCVLHRAFRVMCILVLRSWVLYFLFRVLDIGYWSCVLGCGALMVDVGSWILI